MGRLTGVLADRLTSVLAGRLTSVLADRFTSVLVDRFTAVLVDRLTGHKAYEKGTETLTRLVKVFGQDILDNNGKIDRRVLGSKVFTDKGQLEKLNQIVWPAIAELALKEIDAYSKEGKDVVVLDAAVLLEAGWDTMVHEVWTTSVPKDEAVRRIMERNKISKEEATRRIESQLSNQARVNRANVIICTLWEYEVTQKQVEKAWSLLKMRLPQTVSGPC
ncbi:Bifunctional coenzyme A synthase [Lamellibrachia satsuma]|nr:Bifunctional coenzyme A synthase [Lamellibrachia satsuma]